MVELSGQEQRRWIGFTLVEMLVVLAIVILLASGLVTVGNYVRQNALVHTTEGTIQMVVLALQEYQQHQEKGGASGDLMFPESPYGEYLVRGEVGEPWNDDNINDALDTIPMDDPPGIATLYVLNEDHLTDKEVKELSLDEQNDRLEARVSVEVMYWHLNQVPACQAVLDGLMDDARDNMDGVNDHGDGVIVKGEPASLFEVMDAWGRPLRYRTLGSGNFPRVDSAGPDGIFDTADDVLSSEL